jgi:predicted DCC family thiol-disulfide oxidoreductase YuxK
MNPELSGKTLVLFDGVCGFCNASVQFLLRHDPAGRFRFAPLQGPAAREILTRHGKNPDDLDTVYVVEQPGQPGETLFSRSRAALHCTSLMGWPWKALSFARVLPTSLLDVGYDLVARFRYRIFGKLDACMIPTREVRERFLDA